MKIDYDRDWKAKIARNYFSQTWNGPGKLGVDDGESNIKNLYQCIDETFHSDYLFTRPNGVVINSGTKKLKQILYELTVPLKNLKMTSFDVIDLTQDSVTFQSTSVADKKLEYERYVQYLRLTYVFRDQKVSRAIVHFHTNYDEI